MLLSSCINIATLSSSPVASRLKLWFPQSDVDANSVYPQTLAGLSALTKLYLDAGSEYGSAMPGCEELACLYSTSLQHLTIYLKQVLVGSATRASAKATSRRGLTAIVQD